MGFRFRKSINLGGGFKVNLSKSGVGHSWGTRGLRYTKTARGKKRRTLSIPGTGVSYVTESGGKTGTSKPGNPTKPRNSPTANSNHTGNDKSGMVWLKWILCTFFGFLGVHKFMEKKTGMGILYLFTLGLFGFGWFYDSIRYLIIAIKSTGITADSAEKYSFSIKKGGIWVLAVFLILLGFACISHIPGMMADISTPAGKSQEALPANLTDADSTVSITEATTEPETEVPAEVAGISLDGGVDIVGIGRTENVAFVLSPVGATTDALEVSIDHPEIATVSLEKKEESILQVTGLAPGEVTITLSSGEGIAASKTLTIAEVMPEGIAITAEPQNLRIGTEGIFTLEFDPSDVTDQSVCWESDAPDVLQVKEDGSYEAHSIGVATITATHNNGVTGTLLVEVLPVDVETVTLSTGWEEGKPFYKNDSMTLTPAISPENATEKMLTWHSSDETVATVSENGVVKALSPGTACITAEAANGVAGTYEVVVDVSPQSFWVSASISMKSNDHVGNRWTSGFEFNSEELHSGSSVIITPGETFTVCGWAQDNDSRPDYGRYQKQLTLTEEMCKSGFTIEGEANVYENSGRYSGNCAVWYVKITFTPIN